VQDGSFEFETDKGVEDFESICASKFKNGVWNIFVESTCAVFKGQVVGAPERNSSLSGAKLESERPSMALLQFVRG
jgi:hypothetical protein